jgi:diguanylate cyclase (GGDEF)-like protein
MAANAPTRRHRRRRILAGALLLGFAWTLVAGLGHFVFDSHTMELVGLGALLITCFITGVVGWRQASELHDLAQTDPLTGLLNHRGFHEALEIELEACRRVGAGLALVTLDLDDFKAVNDAHGHPYGDDVLRGIGAQLRSSVREGDLAARVGGEEFALILPHTGPEDAYEVAERARAAVARVPVHRFKLSCSAGIAAFPVDAEDASTLVQLADGALYWAKSAGKQRTRRYDPERVQRSLSDRQAEEIAELLSEEGALVARFQPVVSLSTGRLIGYEALARFPHSPARQAGAWFTMAHACGRGPELEALAIRAALEPLGRPPGTHLALNVSPSVLISEAVRQVLPRDLSEIVIEVTEHEALAEDAGVAEALADLRERGARIAVDDAGAGYSGLRQLTQVKPDVVKLDRNLTQDVHTDPARMVLIESFVRFARRTGAVVCAEGIETLDELSALADLDVAWGQGFVLCPPGEPWQPVDPAAARVCRAGLADAMKPPHAASEAIVAGDRGLELLSARIAGARTTQDLADALPMLAAELNADEITISQWHQDAGILETLAETVRVEQTRYDIAEFPLTARVLRTQRAVQVMVGDPEADEDEVGLLLRFGYGSVLIVPVVVAGESIGAIEAYCRGERPWSRAEINRARIISNQFASVVEALSVEPR